MNGNEVLLVCRVQNENIVRVSGCSISTEPTKVHKSEYGETSLNFATRLANGLMNEARKPRSLEILNSGMISIVSGKASHKDDMH
jgi:hypothetical protein